MFGEIRGGTGGKGGGIIEGEVVEEMRKNEGQGAQDRNTHGGQSEWTLQMLEALFVHFCELPRDMRLCKPMHFWLVSAFARTSGRDPAVLHHVFERIEDRFPATIALTCGGTISQ